MVKPSIWTEYKNADPQLVAMVKDKLKKCVSKDPTNEETYKVEGNQYNTLECFIAYHELIEMCIADVELLLLGYPVIDTFKYIGSKMSSKMYLDNMTIDTLKKWCKEVPDLRQVTKDLSLTWSPVSGELSGYVCKRAMENPERHDEPSDYSSLLKCRDEVADFLKISKSSIPVDPNIFPYQTKYKLGYCKTIFLPRLIRMRDYEYNPYIEEAIKDLTEFTSNRTSK